VSEFSTLNQATATAASKPSVSRNVQEIRKHETEFIEELEAANAKGTAIVYPVARRTKYCACPDNAPTDCRYHSRSEPGWEVCPEITDAAQIGVLKKGRWLYVTTGEPLNQDDPTEAQDKALEQRLSNELIRSVQ